MPTNCWTTSKCQVVLWVPNRTTLAAGETDVFKHPFNTINRYRVPGKVNINDMAAQDEDDPTKSVVWDAVSANQVPWNVLKESLYGDYEEEPDTATDFENPFRPAAWANLVPGQTVPITGAGCSLLRAQSSTANPKVPLFDYRLGGIADSPNRSAAFQNSVRTRLGNMVTTKSSVFACWITVGYFEVNEDGELIKDDGDKLIEDETMAQTIEPGEAAEIGGDRGEQIRNRAFFIFDRSIPVAFEPGKNHNVENAILIKSFIE